MSKKLTITVEDEVYEGLHKVIGRRRISRFLNDLACPHVLRNEDLAEAYRAMAGTRARGCGMGGEPHRGHSAG
jgi:predicted CopG family antitoxin